MHVCTHEGYDITVHAQRRARGHIVTTEIRKGTAAWARYRDLPPAEDSATVERAALAEALAMIQAMRDD